MNDGQTLSKADMPLRVANAIVLVNAAAGSVNDSKASSQAIVAAFARHGVEVTIRPVEGREIAAAAGEFAASRAKDASRDTTALVVAGGDGSISSVAGALVGTDLPLGILPMGTLNHFSKDLGLPLEIEKVAGLIAAGHTRKVDVAELNGRTFVNNSSIGLYPFMVARRNAQQRRRGMRKWLATVPALLQTLAGASWHRLEIAAAGQRQRVRTPCIFVGNNPYELGLKAFGTRARLDSGELDVHVIRQQTRLGLLLLPFKIAAGTVDRERDVEFFRCAKFEIVSRQRALRVSLDGEIAVMATPLHYRSRPGALRVFCEVLPGSAG